MVSSRIKGMIEIKRAAAHDARWHVGQVRCSGSSLGLPRTPAFPFVPGMGGHHPASGLWPAPLCDPTPWAGMAKPPLSSGEDRAKVWLCPFLPNPPASGSPHRLCCPGHEPPQTPRGVQGWHAPTQPALPRAPWHPRPPHPAQGPLSKVGEPLQHGGLVKSPAPGPRGTPSFRYFKQMSNASDYALAGWRGGESRPR